MPRAPTSTQTLPSVAPTTPTPQGQRVSKGLVNTAIAKDGSIGLAALTPMESPKQPELVGPPTSDAKPKKGLLNKQIVKDQSVETKPKEPVAEDIPAPSPAPTQKKNHLDMKAIAAW